MRVIPHGVDRSLFFPLEPTARAAVRARLGFAPDETICSASADPFGTRGPTSCSRPSPFCATWPPRPTGPEGPEQRLRRRHEGLGRPSRRAAPRIARRRYARRHQYHPRYARLRSTAGIVRHRRRVCFALPRGRVQHAGARGDRLRRTGHRHVGRGDRRLLSRTARPLLPSVAGVLAAEPGFPPPRFMQPSIDDLVEAMDRVADSIPTAR